ncbi:MAG: hypothetical protein KatS3mg076_1478 [Candidatus Binatia bacterium]|nr:MAG: hypothetical protein KatS3mg076_1478 [Candidatus Binatia bacterium]
MKELVLDESSRSEIEEHARACYPEECCGIVVEKAGRLEVVRVTNVQNEYHARDPVTFPRTARTAYKMGPEALPVLRDAERGSCRIHAFYHSHPDHDAYFSAEDRAAALAGWDEPSYPDAGQIVVSVRNGEVRDMKAFAWDPEAADFLEIPLRWR